MRTHIQSTHAHQQRFTVTAKYMNMITDVLHVLYIYVHANARIQSPDTCRKRYRDAATAAITLLVASKHSPTAVLQQHEHCSDLSRQTRVTGVFQPTTVTSPSTVIALRYVATTRRRVTSKKCNALSAVSFPNPPTGPTAR